VQVIEVEGFCLAHPLFYDTESRWDDESTIYPFARDPVPAGWRRQERDVWVTMTPEGNRMPSQGWKIHVSACVDNGERVLGTVHRYCLERDIPFKFLRGRNVLKAHNLKYADRSYSGKLLTIYPDQSRLRAVLEDLAAALAGEPGPYILTDLRWGDGPLYVRYGAFVDRYCPDGDGYLVPAIARPDGTLVPDRRTPVFHVPDWVDLPDFLAPHLAARTQQGPVDFPYQIESALHFSNGGGVYLARDAGGRQVVLKEARPHAGLDGDERDAITRLRVERDALRRLEGIPGVPDIYDYRVVWEHEFLVQEFLPGESLFSWLALHYPLVRADPTEDGIAAYTARAASVADQIERIVTEIHDRGMVIGDLHPNNIMVDDDDRVGLIDLETAHGADATESGGLAFPGFQTMTKTGRDADRHAVASIRLWLLMPLLQLTDLAPGKVPLYVTEAVERFAPPPGYVAAIRSELLPGGQAGGTAGGSAGGSAGGPAGGGTGDEVMGPDPDWVAVQKSMVEAILLSATPERTDRLFPGDVRQFATEGGGVTLAHGAAGVLWAMHVAGAGRSPSHEEWLLSAVARTPLPHPGLYDGLWGLAFVLDEFGYRDEARRLVDRALTLTRAQRDVSLQSGLAGAGLALLHFSDRDGDPAFADAALELARRLEDAVRDGGPHGIDELSGGLPGSGISSLGTRGGVLRGWTGVGLLFLRMYERTGDAALLDLAVAALHRDLDLCKPCPDGSLQVDGGFRLLPYLQIGSAGIALVGAELSRHRDDARLGESLPSLVRAMGPEFVVEPQVGNGRAGLIACLAGVAALRPDLVPDSWIDRHLRRLHWHAVPYRGQLAFPGGGLRRLSMDLLTGNAGVMLAIRAAVDAPTAFLPLLERGVIPERR
jgi:tRNA A-37 threonylcarbamoyl transferase component Bud32